MATVQDVQTAADYEAVLRHAAFKGYQVANLITPPLYVAICLARKRPMSVNAFLRNMWVSSVFGTAGGAAAAVAKLRDADPESITDRRVRLAYNRTQIRTDDHSTIGIILGSVLAPAIFWRRGRIINLVLGGAALGSGAGIMTHLYRSWQEGEEINPEGMRDEVEEALKKSPHTSTPS
jgi:hypothetical protein